MVRSHSLWIGLVLASVASPAIAAKADRASEVAMTARVCDSITTDAARVARQLGAAGWKSSTPAFGGQSMASITGSEQYNRGLDSALISGVGSIVGPNCQFDFRKISREIYSAVRAKLKAELGEPAKESPTATTWQNGKVSYSLLQRSPDTATLLWLLETKAPN